MFLTWNNLKRNEPIGVIKDDEGNIFGFLCAGNSIYDGHSRFMVSCWVIYSYL